jgi:small subunit ribosomal protein S1
MTSNSSEPHVDEKQPLDVGSVPNREPQNDQIAAPVDATQPEASATVQAADSEGSSDEKPAGGSTSGRTSIQIGSRRGMVPRELRTSLPRTSVPPTQPVRPAASPVRPAPAPAPAPVASAPETSVPQVPVPPPATEAADEVVTRLEELRTRKTDGPIPTPSRRDPLPAELERELEAAMADISLDRIANDVKVGIASQASETLEPDTRLHGILVRLHGDNAFFALGGRNEGIASVRQFREKPTLGAEMEVVIRKFLQEEGLYELAIPGQSVSVGDWTDLVEGTVVEARITGANTGGLECMVNNIRGFIPASQIGLFRVADFAEYIGQKLLCVATEVNRRRKNLVLSHRALAEREKEESRRKLIEEIEAGQTREGVVRSIQDFGAFVDLGGVDGLIHISQLSWDRVNHPSEILHEGQKVRVKVEKVNRETGKIGLSYRDLLDRPWSHAEENFAPGAVVKGVVSRIAKFGAFVKLAAGIEGLVHISELAHHRVRTVGDVLQEGQEIEVKVISIDQTAQRIALSVKGTLPEPVVEEPTPEPEPETPARPEPPKRKRPLKGGFDRPTGGDQFGLRW